MHKVVGVLRRKSVLIKLHFLSGERLSNMANNLPRGTLAIPS